MFLSTGKSKPIDGDNTQKIQHVGSILSSVSQNVPFLQIGGLLEAHQRVDHTVEIVEEGDQVKAHLTPGLFLAVVKDVCVHDTDGIIHDLGAVRWSVEKPPQMVEEQRDI